MSIRSIASMRSGVSVSDTSEAIRSPAFTPARSASCSPTARTRPMNIPPLPVTGLWCLPRSSTSARTWAATADGSPPLASTICRNDAESILSASTSQRISLACATGVASSFRAPCGKAPAGSSTRWLPSEQSLRVRLISYRRRPRAATRALPQPPFRRSRGRCRHARRGSKARSSSACGRSRGRP